MQCLVGHMLVIVGACHVQCLDGHMLVIVGACHVQCLVVWSMLVIVGACHVQCLIVWSMLVIVGASHVQCLVGYMLVIVGNVICSVLLLDVRWKFLGLSCAVSCCWVYISYSRTCHVQCLVVLMSPN